MEEIRLGTIGSGFIVRNILDVVRSTDGISLEAVYSRDHKRGENLARQYGVGKVYTQMHELFRDNSVNFVYIASPNSLHYEQTRAALLAGKNVICEKPFATKRSHVEELRDLAEEKGLFLIDATPTSYLPNFGVLEQNINKIGTLRLVQSSYCQYSSRYDQLLAGEIPNVFNLEFAGGCLQDINYYNIYLNIALFGVPESAEYYPNICRTGVDSSGVVIMRYPGFMCECTGAKDTAGCNSVQIQGDRGYIYIENGSNGLQSIRVVVGNEESLINLQTNPNRWFYEIRAITDFVLDDNRSVFNERLAITAEVVGIIEKMRKEKGIVFPGD